MRWTRRQIPGQLPMFMTGREIMTTYQALSGDAFGDSGEPEAEHETWHRKLSEAQSEGTAQSVKAEGVTHPVHLSAQFGDLGQPQVTFGHHRVVSGAAADPDRLMPVMHHETPDDAGVYLMDSD